MNKINKFGKMALGSRLRVLSEVLTENAKSIYDLYDVPLKPKWFPVFYMISKHGEMSISNIANEIGHSHPSVVKIVQELKKAGIASTKRGKNDARKTIVFLTKEGKDITEKIESQYTDVNAAIEELLNNNNHDLWRALDEIEYLISQKSVYRRVLEKKKIRESKSIKVVDYQSKYQHAFRELNKEWIETYFKLEAADLKALDNPDENILQTGGAIVVALSGDEPVGVCALIKLNDERYDYELAKMAVSPNFKGKGIGYLLGNAVIRKAKEFKAKTIYLESNTTLTPAINLYHKLGFTKVQGLNTPYERCNIQMELFLK